MPHILKSEIIEGVAYQLLPNRSIRVYDEDARQVVTHVFYPTADAALVAWTEAVAVARRVS